MHPPDPYVRFAVAVVLLRTIGLVSGACSFTPWNFEDTKCPKGTAEILKEVNEANATIRMCCNPADTEEFQNRQYAARACRVTYCSSGATPNLCSIFNDRYINGTKLEYDEILRTPCEMGSGRSGMNGYCCVKGSLEAELASKLGAEPHEFPHMAKLKMPSSCGGTVYNKRWIITAGHCTVSQETGEVHDVSKMKVILGTNIADVDTAQSEDYVYGVVEAIPHPEFSWMPGKDQSRLINDIALLKLDRDIQFGPYVKALEIAPEGLQTLKYAKHAVVTGWGRTETMRLSGHLQKANFIIRTDENCFVDPSGSHPEYADKADSLLCLGGIVDGQWNPVTGEGDSGGSGICRGSDGKPRLCGIVSFGGSDKLCHDNQDAASCVPSVFTEVAYFNKWVKQHAGEQDPATLYKPNLYGKPVSKGKYEHQVRITSSDGKPCGGTAIAQDVVMTSAHCIMTDNGQSRSGIKVTTQTGKSFGLKGVAALPGFQRMGKPVNIKKQGYHVIRTDNYYKNDLALLKLKGKMDIAPGKLAELPKPDQRPEVAYEVSRFLNTTTSNPLRQREFQILDKTECQTRLDRMARDYGEIKVDRILLCGVETYSGGSQCNRELGGGLLCKGQGSKDVLCGIQVFRLCEFSIPNGFIDVSLFTDWAKQAMKML